MAYENIWLKKGEEKTVVVDGYEVKVDAVTIDNDTGNFMFKYWIDRDEPDHEVFVIVINGIVVKLYFITHYEKESKTQVYTLETFYKNGEIDKETVFEEVRKAVEVYGCAGRTNEMKKIFKERFGDDHNGKGRLDLSRIK